MRQNDNLNYLPWATRISCGFVGYRYYDTAVVGSLLRWVHNKLTKAQQIPDRTGAVETNGIPGRVFLLSGCWDGIPGYRY